MIHTAVQKVPVVGHQQEAPPQSGQVAGHQLPPGAVQMVGGLIQHQIGPLLQKQRGQQSPGLLPAAEGVKRALQDLLLQSKQIQLPPQPPLRPLRHQPGQHLPGGKRGVGYRLWNTAAGLRTGNVPLSFQPALQQPQQGGLAPAVPAHQPQLPIGIQL